MKRLLQTVFACAVMRIVYSVVFFVFGGVVLIALKKYELFAGISTAPARVVGPAEIATLADADASENWQVMIAFRDRLTRHKTLEAAYVDIVRTGAKVPHIFLNQLVHVILRNALDGCDDPFVLRAGELFFRTQRMTLHERADAPTKKRLRHVGLPAAAAGVDARHPGRGRNRHHVG